MYSKVKENLSNLTMKDCILLFLVIPLAFFFAEGGCSGGGGSSSRDSDSNVSITGEFESDTYAKSWFLEEIVPHVIDFAHAFDYTSVSKTFVFYNNGDYEVAEVSSGNFTIAIEDKSPAGMIFVGSQDNYLGYLKLSEQIDALPLHKVKDNVTQIDLGQLESQNQTVNASKDVLSNEMPLTQDEENVLSNSADLFTSIIKNPDVDGNGKIDFLENKYFSMQIFYYMYGGDFVNGNKTPDMNAQDNVMNGFKFGLHGGKDWDEVYFTGPDGSKLDHNASSNNTEYYTDHTYFYSPYVQDPTYPPMGEYQVDYEYSSQNGTLTFNVYNQTDANVNTVFPLPTVHLKDDNATIDRVSWEYKTTDNATLSAEAIIEKVELQISYKNKTLRHDSGKLSNDRQVYTLDEVIMWEDVDNINMAYDDVFDNHNVVTWEKKY